MEPNRVSKKTGAEFVESEFMPLFKISQPLDEGNYQQFSDRLTAIVFDENAQMSIFELRNNINTLME